MAREKNGKKENTLSPARQAIEENYLLRREEYLAAGFREENATISVLKANLMAFATAGPLVAIAGFLFVNRWRDQDLSVEFLPLLLAVVVCIAVHEFLHGIGWSFFCRDGFRSIHIGVQWRMLTPYCHCKEPLRFGPYLFGGLLPLFVLGVGIFVAAYLTGDLFLFFLSAINILSAGGDTTIALLLFKYRDAEILDHPTDCGFVAFRK